MSSNELVLYPVDPFTSFNDRPALIETCHDLGLIGDSFDFFGAVHFRAGRNFLNLIHFNGSHTIIELGPVGETLAEVGRSDSKTTCQMCFSEFDYEPKCWIGGGFYTPPVCPNCDYQIETFPEVIDSWISDRVGYSWECPRCRSVYQIQQLNWWHMAGFTRFAVRIMRIWRNEAVPDLELLKALATLTGSEWDYLYYHV